MRAPAALVAIPLAVGCGLGLAVGEREPATFVLCAAAAALVALIATVGALTSGEASHDATACLVVGALVAGISLGADAAIRAYRSPLYVWFTSERPGGPVVLDGVLREDASPSPAGVTVSVDVREIDRCEAEVLRHSETFRRCSTRGGVRLTVIGTLAARAMGEWRAGRAVRVTATLREPATYRNPGVPDDQRLLARRGISLVGSVKSAAMVEVRARGSIADEWASAFRAWVRKTLSAAVGAWSARSAAVATAIAIGDRTGLAQADEERLQSAGTYHVIAISGGNIAILTMMLLLFGRAFGISPRVAAALSIVLLLSYGRVTGPAPSVDRAIAAAVLLLSGRLLELRAPSINILAVAASLGLAWSPVAVVDPGFLLSFGATLGILVGVPRATAVLRSRERRGRPGAHAPLLWPLRQLMDGAVTMVAATAAAEIALAPLGAALFGRVTCAGLILNLAAIPLMTIVQAASLVALAASLVGPFLAHASGYVVHLAASGLIDSARLVDFAPWVSREIPPPAWVIVGGYYAALILALTCAALAGRFARTLRRCLVATTVLLAITIVAGPHPATREAVPTPSPGVMRVAFLDVGQGDATLVVFPDGRALLVDAAGLPAAPLQDPTDGPAFDIGQRVIARALRAFGVRSLDTFVVTHGDPDHIGGARTILRSFRPRAVWEGVPVPRHDPLRWLADDAASVGAEWRTVQSGDRLRLSGVDLRVLHPPPPDWERQRVRNDDSVVLDVRLGPVSILLPGDIGREGEARVLEHLERAPVTILKAPHHGSATSSTWEFLEALQPRVVIVSAGRDNRFGHPAPVVVQRYRQMGVQMFSTAEDGMVIAETDGRTVEIRTWSGRRVTLATDPAGRQPLH